MAVKLGIMVTHIKAAEAIERLTRRGAIAGLIDESPELKNALADLRWTTNEIENTIVIPDAPPQ